MRERPTNSSCSNKKKDINHLSSEPKGREKYSERERRRERVTFLLVAGGGGEDTF